MLTALVFLLIITVSVSIHEFAHYLNARSVGVEVRAFSVGMGPVLWKRKWRGTEWRLSLLPLGGYVDLPGMAPKVDDEGNLHHPDERSEEHTSELQSRGHLVCRLLLEKKNQPAP